MKTVSLDPNDRTVNCPAVLVQPKQIEEFVLQDKYLIDTSEENIMEVFIHKMIKCHGWTEATSLGQQCLLRAHVLVKERNT